MTKGSVKLHRVYDKPLPQKGHRILVDRLWPRGVAKEDLKPFDWVKDLAPSKELRTWYDHKENRFDEFKDKYMKELDDNDKAQDFVKTVKKEQQKGDVWLLYGAKDEKHNNAVVLKEWLSK
ncbi:DUF488 domain-containing protein [Dolosicoccus paucivorans]|uniref:DUF488 domain-containing protein n=1 Tax=Dolosicoccus paucivorans TaxID=84521 RepID=A0A1G8K1Z7_9LACT|nr:DUF488 family protein [Dolosicoccus paucivorans]PMB84770.1 DUF488 domain-containing protein [Dolosicoccus paucivorans]PMC58204.1 DUF488 domain-containing protein [Dolosicoccus paucivorans]SDI37465.1 Uncharacterized conserved protein YeaO, DUF488 family [Dolosicoccus paucivorans]